MGIQQFLHVITYPLLNLLSTTSSITLSILPVFSQIKDELTSFEYRVTRGKKCRMSAGNDPATIEFRHVLVAVSLYYTKHNTISHKPPPTQI
ncbi:hypothetical protein TNCV_1305441 [Trichonephila clavipes]|nr:hypothetical protein TNCV_1305441 [Trichonephila clavipes]